TSRRRHTRSKRDWSSDVCSSDLINADITASTERLPAPGETVGGGRLSRSPGGKGANQAAAAARLGARTRMVGAVGPDAEGRAMKQALQEAGVIVDDIAEATVE